MRAAIALLMLLVPGCSREIAAPPAPPPAAAVTVVSAEARPYAATVVWRVEHGGSAPYLVQRRHDDDPWKGLAWLATDAQGRLVLEDATVQPGEPYTYRVRVVADDEPAFAGEVAVQVPG